MTAFKVLITGASGVLGRRLMAALTALNIDPIVFDGDIRSVEAIHTQLKQIDSLDVVFHLAAVVPTNTVDRDVIRATEVNAWGTLALATAIYAEQRLQSTHFVYASTSHVYEPDSTPLSETASCKPISAYGLTKYQGERGLMTLIECFSRPITIARIFSLYDESQSGSYLYPAWKQRIEAWDRESDLVVPSGESMRDFSHASLVADQLVKLAFAESSGIVNVGSGQSMTVREFLLREFGAELPLRSSGSGNTLIPGLGKLRRVLGEVK